LFIYNIQSTAISAAQCCSVSEQFLNGTSAQLGYTVPFMSVYAGKYVTENKSKTDTLQKLTQPRKNKQHKIQQNKTSLV